MTPAGETIAAMPADDVAFRRDELAFLEIGHRAADLIDHADEFMADDQRHRDGLLRPRIPVINVNVGPADRGFLHANAHLVRPDFRHRHFLHFQSRLGAGFDHCLHRLAHADEPRHGAPRAAAIVLPSVLAFDFVLPDGVGYVRDGRANHRKPVTGALTFILRFASTIALWSVALLIIFSGYELAFFALIGALRPDHALGVLRDARSKGLPNFKITAMICGVIMLCRQLLLLLEDRAGAILRLRDGGAARFSPHRFHPADV